MWVLVICTDDNADCKITTHDSQEDAMKVLRDEVKHVWEESMEVDQVLGITANTVLARKDSWTLEEIQMWTLGENDINTIHLKEVETKYGPPATG